MAVQRWAPIVYGRTLVADTWWRALPIGLSRNGWLADLVTSVVAGGDQLDRPRFLLARHDQYWVTGVACLARELSQQYGSDGRRPLYTFVGWTTPETEATPPALADLENHYVDWAAPPYQKWVGLDWRTHQSLAREPHQTVATAPPWPTAEEPIATAEFTPTPEGIAIWPAGDRHEVWERGRRTRSPFVLAVGWDLTRNVPRSTITHATAADRSGPGPTHLAVAPDPQASLARRSADPSGSRAPDRPGPSSPQPPRSDEPPIRLPIPNLPDLAAASRGVQSMVTSATRRIVGGELAQIPVGVEVLVVSRNQVLLQRRSEHGTAKRGLPRDNLRSGETPLDACRRLVRKLTGVDVLRFELLEARFRLSNPLMGLRFSCALAAGLDPAQLHLDVTLLSLEDGSLSTDVRNAISNARTSKISYRESR
jgi:ADP-ribose pyrophosphatase YjhB (NUDIX family)